MSAMPEKKIYITHVPNRREKARKKENKDTREGRKHGRVYTPPLGFKLHNGIMLYGIGTYSMDDIYAV